MYPYAVRVCTTHAQPSELCGAVVHHSRTPDFPELGSGGTHSRPKCVCGCVRAMHNRFTKKNRAAAPLHPEQREPLARFRSVGVHQKARMPDEPRGFNGDTPLKGDVHLPRWLPVRAEVDASPLMPAHCLNRCPRWGHLRIVCRTVLRSSAGMALCHTIQYML